MTVHRLFLGFVLLFFMFSMGNAPAPWYACEGKTAGEPCLYGYGCHDNGVCTMTENCKDDPSTPVNECLICRVR